MLGFADTRAFAHTVGGGRLLGSASGKAFKHKCCGGGVYVYLFNPVGTNDLSVRARDTTTGDVLWTYTHASLEGNIQASSLCMTENGVLVFGGLGTTQYWLIGLDGILIRSGSLSISGSPFRAGQVAVRGNRGFIWGNFATASGVPWLAEFNMTTFALVNDATSFYGLWLTGLQFDRAMVLTDSGAGADWIYATGDDEPIRWDPATLATPTYPNDFYTPQFGSNNRWYAYALKDAGAGAFHAQSFNLSCSRNFESPATNYRHGSPLLYSPCWLSDDPSAGVANVVWVNTNGSLQRWSDNTPGLQIDTWAFTNIPGWDIVWDEVWGLNVDADKNFYFWWKHGTGTPTTSLVRLNSDFSTIDFIKADADIQANGQVISRGRQILAIKGNGRSKPSEEAW